MHIATPSGKCERSSVRRSGTPWRAWGGWWCETQTACGWAQAGCVCYCCATHQQTEWPQSASRPYTLYGAQRVRHTSVQRGTQHACVRVCANTHTHGTRNFRRLAKCRTVCMVHLCVVCARRLAARLFLCVHVFAVTGWSACFSRHVDRALSNQPTYVNHHQGQPLVWVR